MSPQDKRILRLIRAGKFTSHDIATALGISRPAASVALYNMAEYGAVVRGPRIITGRGGPPPIRWRIVEAAQ